MKGNNVCVSPRTRLKTHEKPYLYISLLTRNCMFRQLIFSNKSYLLARNVACSNNPVYKLANNDNVFLQAS